MGTYDNSSGYPLHDPAFDHDPCDGCPLEMECDALEDPERCLRDERFKAHSEVA